MKVAHLDTGRQWRGGQAQVLLLMEGLIERGHVCSLLAPPGPLLDRARERGFETASWRARGDLDVASIWAARSILRLWRPDILHCHTARAHALAVAPARLARLPVVVSRRVVVGVGKNVISRLKYRAADRYLCVSRSVMDALERSGVPRGRLAWVPSGVETPLAGEDESAQAERHAGARPANLRDLIGARPGVPLVGTVAALTPEKNHRIVLEVAPRVLSRVAEVHFVWIGEGESRGDLERLRGRLGLERRVHLLGFRADAKTLMRQFTLFVLASSHEGLGTSLLDAQVAGVPVVATRAGGVPEVIEDGETGRLVPPDDAGALASALIEALVSPMLRERWIERARVSARAFSAEAMVERTVVEYRGVLRGS